MLHPVIYICFIPKKTYFIKTVVSKSHTNINHNVIRDIINNLRKKKWVFKGRKLVKAIVNNCSVCRKFEGSSYDYPKIGPLPDLRVTFDFH